MDRIISNKHETAFFKKFEWSDLFPYTIAVVMIFAEIYMVLQFITVAPTINY